MPAILDAEDGSFVQIPVPNIRHLRVVESVARNASVSRAAVEIGLSQPAVSLAISKIESEMGRSLFDRTKNGCYLTGVGEVFINRVRRFLEQSYRAIDQVAPDNDNRRPAYYVTSAQIRCLLAIAASPSFSQAARAIGISTASLHRSARELETNLRAQLYQFSKYGLRLNETGSELARQLGLAAREIEAANDDLRYLDGVESGKIVVGTLPMSGAYVVGATIAEITATYPEAMVHVITAPYDVLIGGLRSGAIDVIFGVLRMPEGIDDLREEALFDDPYCIIGRAGHPLAARSGISMTDLLDYEWIVPQGGSPRRRQYELLFKNMPMQPRTSIVTGSHSAILSILACSDRLALVSRHEVEAEEKLKLVSALHWPAKFPSIEKGITTRANWLPTPIQQRFVSLLRTHSVQAEG